MRTNLLPVVITVLVLAAAACGCAESRAARDQASVAPSAAVSSPTPATRTPTSDPSSGAPAESAGTTSSPNPHRPRAAEQAKLDQQLIAAAWDNDLPRARGLIRRGADVNAQDETRQSAYLIATSEGFLKLLQLTLAHGADVDAKDSYNGTGLIRAADRGHADIAGRLIQAGVKVDHVNNLGWTALHEAIILGDGSTRYVDTVRVLVAAGADVRLPSQRDQVTPLDHARAKGFDGIAQVLQAALRADQVSKRQANQRLIAAASAGDGTAAALALRAGADIETRDDRGRTPLELAVSSDHAVVTRLLVNLGSPR